MLPMYVSRPVSVYVPVREVMHVALRLNCSCPTISPSVFSTLLKAVHSILYNFQICELKPWTPVIDEFGDLLF